MSICEVKEGSKLAIELDPKLSICRPEPDLFVELSDAFGGLDAGVLVIQGFGEIGDLLSVELMEGGAASSRARNSTRLASSTVISSFTAAPETPALMASINRRISRSVFSRSRAVRLR